MGLFQATLQAISTLSTCSHLEWVKDLRSFIGAYKVLARGLCRNTLDLGPVKTL